MWAKSGVATRDLQLLADAWCFLAHLHPPPPQYASSSAWRLRVLEVLLHHPAVAHDTPCGGPPQGVQSGAVGPRVEHRTSEWDGLVMTRVWVLGHVAPLLLCGQAARAAASPEACAGGLDLKIDLMLDLEMELECDDALMPPRMASWRAVVLFLRHTAAFSCSHVAMASCHTLARLALQLGEPVRVTIYQHLASLCTDGSAISAICAAYLAALDQYYLMLEACHHSCSKQTDGAHRDRNSLQPQVEWRKSMQQLVVCTRSLEDMLLPYRKGLHPTSNAGS